MTPPSPVGRTAFLLGFAGLLPPLGAVIWTVLGERDAILVGLIYAFVILSFLGGMWWGLAMRSEERQGVLVAVAVVPSLLACALALAAFPAVMLPNGLPWLAVATGSVVMLTLLVDRWLVAIGLAPANWMRLRVPLSLGLGLLTIAAGVLVGVGG